MRPTSRHSLPTRVGVGAASRAAAASLAALLAACSADQWAHDADLEVGELIRDKEEHLFGKASGFTVEQAQDVLRAQLLAELALHEKERSEQMLREVVPPAVPPPVDDGGEESVGGSKEALALVQQRLSARLTDVEKRHATELTPFLVTDPSLLPRHVISLQDALEIAAGNNRDYYDAKRDVYVSALNLTLERYLFQARFGVTSSYDWTSSEVAGSRQRDGQLTTSFSMTQQLATGGLLVFDFTHDLLRRFTGISFTNGKQHVHSSLLDLSFSQPLLRGAGKTVVQEPLVQSERAAVYALRDFEFFRQQLAVQVASEYYRVLQSVDQIDNARRSYLQFIDSREQSQALADRGRRSQIQLDQAAQSELNARDSWINAQRQYQDALDDFKITLGLPMEADLSLDPAELEKLRAAGLPALTFSETRAQAVALTQRLDHVNVVERNEDAIRQVGVAADDLRTALDLNAGLAIPTEGNTVFDTQAGDATWTAGATIDLPVDKLAERNAYRRALLDRDQRARALSLSEDQVKQDVRIALRRLAQVRESHRIALESVEVAHRRVQSTALTLRFGRIEIRDALDATDALNQAQNDLTQALVDYEVARLQLWRGMGLLRLEGGIVLPDLPPVEAAGAVEGP